MKKHVKIWKASVLALLLIVFCVAFGMAAADDEQKLRNAAIGGDTEQVMELLIAGTNPNAPDSEGGETPLMLAAYAGHIDVAKMLLKAGADIRYVNVKEEKSVLG